MGGRETAHYAQTNKPSWILLLCLWVLEDAHSCEDPLKITRFKTSPNSAVLYSVIEV